MYANGIKLLAYIIIGFFSLTTYAQNQRLADSLETVLKNSDNKNDSLLFRIYEGIAYNSNSPNQNILYANKCLELAKKLNKQKWIAGSYSYLGEGYYLKGDLPEAINCYLRSAEYYALLSNEIGVSTAYQAIGNVYKIQNNFSNAILYFNKSIKIFRNESDSIRLATSLLNVGNILNEYNLLDSASVCYEESARIFDRLDYQIGIAYNLGNIGVIEKKVGNTETAIDKLSRAISILEEYGDTYPIANYASSLSEIFLEQGKHVESLKYGKLSLRLSTEHGLKEQIRDANLKLSKLYGVIEDYPNAYFHQSQYLVYRDSINNEESIRKMADLRTEYEVSKKQTEVDFLSKQSDSRQTILFGMLLVLALSCLLAYVLYKLYKLRGRAIIIAAQRRALVTTQRDTLQELNDTKDKFFSIISHDIRGPVNNFYGVAYLIKMHAESGETSELREVGEMLERSSVELSALLDNLLDWAMSQQGKFPYKLEQFNLAKPCNENLSMMGNIALAKGIKLTENVADKIAVRADFNSVSTIIRNLLNNAIKFTKKGGSITLAVGIEERMATIRIEDTGVGIPDAKMKSLFGFRGERTEWGTDGEKGVGLGLNLVHEFVEMNKGRIEVESEVGVGTSFTVYLPLSSNT